MTLDKIKLIKLLGMTGGSNEGETLNAIRLANSVLKDAGLRWEDVIGGSNISKSSGNDLERNLENILKVYDKIYAKIPQDRRDIAMILEGLAKMHKYSKKFSTLLLFASYKILWGELSDKEYAELKIVFENEMKEYKEKQDKWTRRWGIRFEY